MCLTYNKGCGEGDGCPTRDPLPWPTPARQLSLRSGSFPDPSLATVYSAAVFCCYIVVSEHEADDKLEAVVILRGKPRPQPQVPRTPSVQQYFVGVTRRVGGVGRNVPPHFLQTLNRDEIRGLFCSVECHERTGHKVP